MIRAYTRMIRAYTRMICVSASMRMQALTRMCVYALTYALAYAYVCTHVYVYICRTEMLRFLLWSCQEPANLLLNPYQPAFKLLSPTNNQRVSVSISECQWVSGWWQGGGLVVSVGVIIGVIIGFMSGFDNASNRC